MWRDFQRWELIGLLDDPAQEFLRNNHRAVWDALRNHEHTADTLEPEVVSEFDIHLEWLLKSQGWLAWGTG